jgi:hypothetical protein
VPVSPTSICQEREKRKDKNYAGSKTLPASFKERRHIGPKCRESPTKGKQKTSGDLEGGWKPPAPDRDLENK